MGNTALAVEAIVVAVGDVLVLVAGEVEVVVATEDTTNSSGAGAAACASVAAETVTVVEPAAIDTASVAGVFNRWLKQVLIHHFHVRQSLNEKSRKAKTIEMRSDICLAASLSKLVSMPIFDKWA